MFSAQCGMRMFLVVCDSERKSGGEKGVSVTSLHLS